MSKATTVPVASRLHQSTNEYIQKLTSNTSSSSKAPQNLDDQIAFLERQLENEKSSDESEDSEDSEDKVEDILSLSLHANDRIAPLPACHLPPQKRLKKSLPAPSSLYWPETLRKLPFCCRPCTFQGEDLVAFRKHQTSKEHLTRVQKVSHLLSCKLCKKSFNSPDQLQEHVGGKWHKERSAQRRN